MLTKKKIETRFKCPECGFKIWKDKNGFYWCLNLECDFADKKRTLEEVEKWKKKNK